MSAGNGLSDIGASDVVIMKQKVDIVMACKAINGLVAARKLWKEFGLPGETLERADEPLGEAKFGPQDRSEYVRRRIVGALTVAGESGLTLSEMCNKGQGITADERRVALEALRLQGVVEFCMLRNGRGRSGQAWRMVSAGK
ncbi:hypothetical protein ABMY26_07195 (plasmid) [Azospirillum sp. HJ39]|uniref:hypothetical protein n=1 Tax=Azospirillum sp. HJ39 TaxID=3159496 RepID=UPI003557020F